MTDKMEDIAQNEYNGSLHAVYESWEFAEFCEKELGTKFTSTQDARVRKEVCKKFLPKFYRLHMQTVKKLQDRSKENYVKSGYITSLSHSEKAYNFVLYTNTGSGVALHIPNEFFAKGRYKPKEGDRISYIDDKKGNITFSVRENGEDREIYSLNRNSEEYKSVIKADEERRSVPGDDLAAKAKWMEDESAGLSGDKRDLTRLEVQRHNAIFSGKLRELRNRKLSK